MSEFAPLYSFRQRMLIAAIVLAVATPVYIVGYYWLFPRLEQYAQTASCDRFGAFTGMELLLYGLFTGLPLLMALLIWLIEGRRSIRVWRLGQNPLPGEKVLRSTRYRTGAAARIRPLSVLIVIALLVGIAIRGGLEANALDRDIDSCENPGQARAKTATAAKTSGTAASKLIKSAARHKQRNYSWQFTNVKSAA